MLFHCQQHSNDKKSEEARDLHKMYVTDLEFGPSPINPFSIIGHSIDIGECLNSSFDISRVVQDTTIAIHEVDDGW